MKIIEYFHSHNSLLGNLFVPAGTAGKLNFNWLQSSERFKPLAHLQLQMRLFHEFILNIKEFYMFFQFLHYVI